MALREILTTVTVSNAMLLFVAYCLGWIVYCKTLHPLAHVPGPLWPAISRTWARYRNLHAKYGPLVRMGPNEVSCSDPAAILLIYRERSPLAKTSWYETFRPQGVSDQADLFTETNEEKHTRYRKIVGPAYHMSVVLKNESAIDECTSLFIKRLDDFAARKQSFDFGHWLEMFAYDVIGRVLYGEMLGFLETGTDIGRWMESVTHALPLLHIAATAPKYMLAPIMITTMLIPGMAKNFSAVGEITAQAKRKTEDRMKEEEGEAGSQDIRGSKSQRHDVMSQLFTIMHARGSEVGFTHREITLESWAGIIAGSDSTATTMRAVFYYLMKNPSALSKAVTEVQEADKKSLLSTPVQFNETMSHLPYVCAAIKEAMRLFPSFATRLRRVAPAQGLDLAGYHVPAGCWVGINPFVIQRDKAVFGDDADSFRPERWLESTEKNHAMEKGMLVWGAGTRTCVGKNIALAEMHKLVPELLRRFDIEMAHGREWKTWNAGFIKQSDVVVNLKVRE
ncbi:pisatin demethylase [Phaeosphaeria sp. MPI-PUGE-AT-0046c]|nr:pisatin demethylase [Phaeosphaeria sp. MPI-PUGE-AT-0046c]